MSVAIHCFQKYRPIKPDFPAGLREDLEGQADYFFDRGTLQTLFIRKFIPWEQFVGETNAGHEAIADFLLSGAADHAITTNVDWLIERAAWDRLGGDLSGALTSAEAILQETDHRVLLKPHGCGVRDRDNTVWSKKQLEVHPVDDRIAGLRTWLGVRLQQKDVVVTGFWSDWGYLNEALVSCMSVAQPARVIVVDPAETGALQGKAPVLWATLSREGIQFQHIRMTGEGFLADLRHAYSRWYVRQLLHSGVATYETTFGEACPAEWLATVDLQDGDLYTVRRDAEGKRIGRPARQRSPGVEAEAFGFFLLALRKAGAGREGSLYRLPDGRLLRVLNGSGRSLAAMELEYRAEPPLVAKADVVACIGATDYAVPGDILMECSPKFCSPGGA